VTNTNQLKIVPFSSSIFPHRLPDKWRKGRGNNQIISPIARFIQAVDAEPDQNPSSITWASNSENARGRRGIFLDFPSPETSLSFNERDLEAQFGCFLFEEVDLLSAVSVLVVLSTFANISLTVLQHSTDQAGEPVGHRGNGFRST
jgi:hypothetical protein